MTSTPSELRELQDSFRAVLTTEASRDRVRSVIETGAPIDRGLWATIAELGWTSLVVPEEYGGLGLGFVEMAALYAELGRSLAAVPLVATLLLAEAIAASGSATQKEAWLSKFATGEIIGSASTSDAITARYTDLPEGGVRLSGHVDWLLDGGHAQLLLVFAHNANGGICATLLKPDELDAQIEVRRTQDLTRHLAKLELNGAHIPEDRILARNEGARDLQQRILAHGALAIIQDSLGGAEAIFESTLEFLKVRVQFDRPIGSFQALKHRCANHSTALVASRALAEEALRAWGSQAGLYGTLALGKANACEVFDAIADDALQMHGGIGLTWEHDCHLYLKRAKLNRQLFSPPERHFDLAFERIATGAEAA